MFWLGLAIGALVGANFGALTMALFKNNDKKSDR